MRILILFNRYEFRGGEDTYVENLTKLLKSHGHQVYVFTKDSREILTFLDRIKTGIGIIWNLAVERELDLIIRRFRPDVAHFHNIYPLISPLAYRVCARHKVKIVQTIHNYKFMCSNNSLYRAGKICELCPKKRTFLPSLFFSCYHNSFFASLMYAISVTFHSMIHTFDMIDEYVFPSPFTQAYYNRYWKLSLKKSHYLPYHSYPQKDIGGGRKERYFLYLGRMTTEKGVEELAQAFSSHSRLSALFIGNGPLAKYLRGLEKKYKNITYIPHLTHDKVYRYIKDSYAVIVPSRWFEVLPNVILEAIQAKKTVLVPASNPNLSLLKDKSEYIITYSDMENLVKQAKKLMQVKKMEFTKKSGTFSRQLSPDYHYKKIMSIYAP